jgi:hypothetical protein
MGQARERSDVARAEIAYDKQAPLFVISPQGEKRVRSGYAWGTWLWSIFGFVPAIASGAVLDAASLQGRGYREYEPHGIEVLFAFPSAWIAAGAFCALWLVLWTLTWYNTLVELRQRVKQAWANIDVQLKRRVDLIPRLVETVSGMRDYERSLQTELARLRSQALATPPGHAGPDYQRCAASVATIVERYPELAANGAFIDLQRALTDCEDRIALARGYFNDIATFHNTKLEEVPSRWIARMARMEKQKLLGEG